MNCLSRLVSGLLIDRVGYNKLMTGIGLLLTLDLATIYFLGQLHFSALIICVWLVYFFAFAQFSTITAQVTGDKCQRSNKVQLTPRPTDCSLAPMSLWLSAVWASHNHSPMGLWGSSTR